MPEGTLQQGIIGGTPKTLTAAIAIVDVGGGSPNLTLDKARARMFSTTETTASKDASLKFFYAENSYGLMDVQGEAYDEITYAMSSCDYNGLSKSVNSQIMTKAGKSFNKYVYYFGTKVSACQWSGLGGGNSAWLNGTIGCTVLMQEFGHAVNLPHSSTMKCSDGPMSDNPSGCTHNEYGGRHSPMGSSCYHMTGWEKWREGWLSGCNAVRVKGSGGSFTLHPLELPCNGVQVLQIPMAKTRPGPGSESGTMLSHYYVEMRGAYGLDTALKPQVLVYAANDVQVMTGKGGIGNSRAWVLDVNTADTSINGWGIPVGQSYSDPAGGVKITVTSITATEATVDVEITNTTVANATGSTVCMDSSAFTPPGSAECSATPARPGNTGGGGVLSTGGSGGGAGAGAGGTTPRGGAGGTAGVPNAGRSGGGALTTGGFGSSGAPTAGNQSGGASGASGNVGTGGIVGLTGGATSTSGGSSSGGALGSGGFITVSGGLPGAGGSPGGSSSAGAGPLIPAAGAAGRPVVLPPETVGEGCTCSVGPGRERASPWSLAALGLILTRWMGRRRAGRRRDGPEPQSPR
jgi:hypothetical protein